LFAAYEKKFNKGFRKILETEFSGDMRKVLIGYYDIIANLPMFLAIRFEKTMYGIGTSDTKLISLTARCRNPLLMNQIKIAYQPKYGKTLVKRIQDDTSGDYEKLLVAMVDPK
jgi:annexin A7/11